jgi:hypothetical protein
MESSPNSRSIRFEVLGAGAGADVCADSGFFGCGPFVRND